MDWQGQLHCRGGCRRQRRGGAVWNNAALGSKRRGPGPVALARPRRAARAAEDTILLVFCAGLGRLLTGCWDGWRLPDQVVEHAGVLLALEQQRPARHPRWLVLLRLGNHNRTRLQVSVTARDRHHVVEVPAPPAAERRRLLAGASLLLPPHLHRKDLAPGVPPICVCLAAGPHLEERNTAINTGSSRVRPLIWSRITTHSIRGSQCIEKSESDALGPSKAPC
jgi:hypothetical protein